jgi:hypothetical protein
MGGRGSGRCRWSNQTTTEGTCRIDIRYLRKIGWLEELRVGTLSWNCDGEPSGSVNVKTLGNRMELSFRARVYGGDWESIEQTINFVTTPCNYGGNRKWFLCPGCLARVALLYAGGTHFLCRHCYRLPYSSQQETFTDRMMRKCRKIRTRLEASHNLFEPIWEKPKGMHWRTFDRLVREDEIANYASMFAMGLKLGIIDG